MKLAIVFLSAIFVFSAAAQTPNFAPPKTEVLKCKGFFSEGSHPTQADVTISAGEYPSDRKVNLAISQSSPLPHNIDCNLEFFIPLSVEGVFQHKDLNFVEAAKCKSSALTGNDPEDESSWEKTEPLMAWSFEFVALNYNVSSFEYESLYKVKYSGAGSIDNVLICKDVRSLDG